MGSPRSPSISQVLKLKHELEAKLGGIRDEVRGLAYQVKTLASADDTAVAKPAAVPLSGAALAVCRSDAAKRASVGAPRLLQAAHT